VKHAGAAAPAIPSAPSPASRTAGSKHATLGTASAHGLSWLLLALVNAGVLAITLPSGTWASLSERLAHQYYDFAHLVMLGFVSFAAVKAWTRFGSKRWWVTALVQAGIASGVALLVMDEDLHGLVRRQATEGSTSLWYALDCVAVGVGVAVMMSLAKVMARPYLRWGTVVAGLVVAIGNHLILRFNYPGLHFFALWAAALALGTSLSTLPIKRGIRRRGREALLVASVAVVVASFPSLLVRPSSQVWQDLFRSPGSALAPLLARIKTADEVVPLVIEGSPWFQRRDGMPSIAPTRPKIIPNNAITLLITIEALRYDVTLGQHAEQLPNLEAIRQQSVEFSMARSPSASTITSATSLFTGQYYSGLYWSPFPEKGKHKGSIVPYEDPSPRLPEMLSEAGVRTVDVMAIPGFKRRLGIGRGFDEQIKTRRDWGRAREMMDKALARLRTQGDDEPLFLYMHFVDSHAPYTLAGKKGTPYERYVREVALIDKQIGRLRAYLSANDLENRALLIVSADHGEAFGEHGTKYHAVTLYEELLRIPLFISFPGAQHRVIDQPVTLIDLGPTILDAYGLHTPAPFLGQSLVPLLRGENVRLTRPLAAEGGRRLEALFFDDGRKTIVDLKKKTREVYDLSEDPKESRNLVGVQGSRADYYLRVHRAFFNAHEFPKPGYEPPWRPF